jgi:hypothetical protein
MWEVMVICAANLNAFPSEESGVKHHNVVQLCSVEGVHIYQHWNSKLIL